MADLLDSFVGKWELDPATLDYQHGRPGLRAVYTIRRTEDGLEFELDADNADGVPMHFIYGGKLDGEFRQTPGFPAVAMSLLEDGSIESLARQNGVIVDRWTRTVTDDGIALLICQHGADAAGRPFKNSGLYPKTG